MTMVTWENPSATPAVEALDHVAYHVGNAKTAEFSDIHGVGFHLFAHAGPETGVLGPGSPVAVSHAAHGDGQ